MKNLKTYLIGGILVWLPIAVTVWLLNLLITTTNQLLPEQTSLWLFGRHIPGIGLLLVFLVVLFTGVITRNIIGLKLINLWEKIFSNTPIVKSIYKSIKQVSDTLLSTNSKAFRQAVLVQFPNSNAWTIAFITGEPVDILDNHEQYLNVYVPTTPNPTSGYFIIVKKSDTKNLDMSVDEALRYVISMGTVPNPKKTTN